ncbi:hypothetical protein ACFQL4_18615 [Halosimplex aquaticum]
MSDSQQYEKVSVSAHGVTVDKRFEEDEFPVPAIAFEIQSVRSETVTVTLVDDVPEDVAVEDLGFHPEYGSEYWTIDEDQITFERELEAGAEYTTVYGIRATGTDNVEQFLTQPRIEQVDPPLEDGGGGPVVDEQGSDVVRDVISGDSDAVPGLDDADDADEGDDVETLDLKDPNEPADSGGSSGSSGSPSGSSGGSSGGGVSLDDADVDTLVGALATEIRNQNVDAEDVKLLRKAFDLADDSGGSADARIQHLQTEVSDLLAYTGALEEFLDENGTGDEIIDEFREQVESFESELQDVRDMASGHDEALSSVEGSVAEVESSMESLQSDMDELLSEVEAVQSDVETVESSVDDVEGDVDDLEQQIGDIDVEDVKSDIEDINDEIEELEEWREQLSSVIGGS